MNLLGTAETGLPSRIDAINSWLSVGTGSLPAASPIQSTSLHPFVRYLVMTRMAVRTIHFFGIFSVKDCTGGRGAADAGSR